MRHPDIAGKIVRAVKAAVKIPVTVKKEQVGKKTIKRRQFAKMLVLWR